MSFSGEAFATASNKSTFSNAMSLSSNQKRRTQIYPIHVRLCTFLIFNYCPIDVVSGNVLPPSITICVPVM